ncbi:hypothetical protein PENARI_c004G02636 [Penicillium arizonense]|uniref:SprT-like domain-containing protein n=1 Tax=Penicillium arizonense TaxID=1835702 RepID=A0A1F5LS10_PENAI|nr:hypothetical protein PENARI_c004G02636 [Penicillium arizonense]OGE55729.1 hypothetical protein PENARI_c004G02636 [Penicillium arizonense]
MARLNSANPLVNRTSPEKTLANMSPKKPTLRQLPPPTSDMFDDILLASVSGASTRRPATQNKSPMRTQSQTQRRTAAGAGTFDILQDSNSFCESETESRASPSTKKKPRALGISRVNSLLLSRPARPVPPRQRVSIKSDKDDDKENDVSDEFTEEYLAVNRSSPRHSALQSPVRSSASHTSVRQSVIDDRYEEDQSEGDSFDSLDDFIVSDDNEPSYHEISENEGSETEAEMRRSPSPERSPRKRLIRGRRPISQREINMEEESLSIEEALSSPKQKESSPRKMAGATSSPGCESPILHAVAPEPRAGSTSSSQLGFDSSTHLINSLRELELDTEDESPSPPARIESRPQSSVDFSSPRANSKSHGPYDLTIEPFIPTLEAPSRLPNKNPSHLLETESFNSSPEAPSQPPNRNPLHFLVNRSVTPIDKSPKIMPKVKSTPKKAADKPPSKTALKKAEAAARRQARDEKKAFDQSKELFAETFIRILDETVVNGEIARMTQATGGIQIKWNNLLQSTAGRAKFGISPPKSPGTDSGYSALIELNPKVLDSEDRILCTATHEYCHLVDGLISRQNGHGPSFHQWAARCVEAMAGHHDYGGGRIKVTTRHSYEIDYKYSWVCQACGRKYGRSSKSINPEVQRCTCQNGGGLLVQVKPKPRAKKAVGIEDKENENPTL